jgi:UDP-N-acetylmuramoylalanine--D-glutamate ligase
MNNSSFLLDHSSFLIFGAARSGLAAARLLQSLDKRVALYDEAQGARGEEVRSLAEAAGVPLLTHLDEEEIAGQWEVLVLSPGIPPTHPLVSAAEESGCVVRSEIEIGYQACPAPIAAITGTNGKTTVTHLLTHLLQQAGRPAVMAGNVGRALCDAVLEEPQLREPDAAVVCEVSSYQLETIERFNPKVACVLNITPDHLDRYKVMTNYMEAKRRVTENQGREEVLVLNADDKNCLSFLPRVRATVWQFSLCNPVSRGAFLSGDTLFLAPGEGMAPIAVMSRSEVPLPGSHNVANVLAALIMGHVLGLESETMAQAVRTFRAVAHRIELIREIGGVRFFNDSKATNLDSVEKALEGFADPRTEPGIQPDCRVILIAGGRDKGAPWTPLCALVRRSVKGLICIGEAAPIARKAWGECVATVCDAGDMEEALCIARSLAKPGDVVLLSPGCASFDMYKNFEERGDHFRSIVLGMPEESSPLTA